MRKVNFRDDVLWAVAWKLGLDPEISFLKNQAYALASYINAYVRRLWDSNDWVEWTVTGQFSVDTDPRNLHNVSWNAIPSDYLGFDGPQAPAPTAPVPLIGKVLKVYLVDPRSSWAPIDTPYRLGQRGIHVGFEHGPSVWIKYISRAPQFTAKEWDTTVTYNKGDLTYSPLTGECYTSKSSNNLGHDPSQPGGGGQPLPPAVAETPLTPDNPGLAATAKILDVMAALPASANGAGAIPDPPAAGAIGTVVATAADGVSVLATAAHTATGSESLLAIFTNLQGQLSAALSGFTVTLITTPLSIRLENTSDFIVSQGTASTSSGPTLPLAVVQVQPYVPATPFVAGTGQTFELTLTQDQVVPGALYTLTFTTVDSKEHVAAYTAAVTDNAQQILSGLINNIVTLQPADPFFTAVQSTLDTVSPSATFTIDKTFGMVSMHPDIAQQGSTFWDLVPFPFAIVDAVVTGAYAEALKESGQSDKAGGEEQKVPTEVQLREGAQVGQQYDVSTDQQQQSSRYAIK